MVVVMLSSLFGSGGGGGGKSSVSHSAEFREGKPLSGCFTGALDALGCDGIVSASFMDIEFMDWDKELTFG